MKSLLELKCPRCGADLNVEDDREILFCQYCGAKIIMTDENTFTINKTIHTIDDADIARAETDRMVQKHKIEMEEELSRRNAKMHKLKVFASFFLGLCALTILVESPLTSLMCTAGIILIWNSKNMFSK